MTRSAVLFALLRKAQIMGQTAFKEALRLDPSLRVNYDNEWGRSPGYRDWVAQWDQLWFSTDPN